MSSPVTPAVAPAPAPVKKSKKIWWIIGGSVAVLGLLAGGGYWAYAHGFITIPGVSPKPSTLFATMVSKMDSVENAKYGLSVSVVTQNRHAGATPTFPSVANINTSDSTSGISGAAGALLGMADPSTIITALPSDISLQAGMSIQAEIQKPVKDADGEFQLTGSYSAGDSSYALDVDLRKIGANLYGILNKVPSLPYFDLSSIKGSWVVLTPEDFGTTADLMWSTTDPREGMKQLKNAATTALSHNVLTVDKTLPEATVNGARVTQYTVVIHPDQIVPTYQDLRDAQAKKNANTSAYDDIITELKKTETQNILSQLAKASQITISVDKAKGFLQKLDWKITLVPPDDIEKLKTKEFVVDIALTLDQINSQVNIVAPTKTINYDEATRLVTGQTLSEQQFEKQTQRVSSLRSALAHYYEQKKTFPTSITNLQADLKKAYDDCVAAEAPKKKAYEEQQNVNKQKSNLNDDYTIPYYSQCRITQSVNTTDIYTGKPFEYTGKGDDYAFTYQIKFDDKTDSYTKKSYVDGKNTATRAYSSLEQKYGYDDIYIPPDTTSNSNANTNSSANVNFVIENIGSQVDLAPSSSPYSCFSGLPVKGIDSDKDGLSDYDEVYIYYTKPCTADSDGDGHLDGAEVSAGYDPLGPGKASATEVSGWATARNIYYPSTSTNTNSSKTTTTIVTPTITQHTVSSAGGYALVTWSTSAATDATINYGSTDNYGQYISSTPYTFTHSLTFPTTPGLTYHFALRSCVQGSTVLNGCVTSPDYTITGQ